MPVTTVLTNQDRVGRWYFGGLAGACAACCTHPLDLMKVHLQTQQTGKLTLPSLTLKIFRSDGLPGFCEFFWSGKISVIEWLALKMLDTNFDANSKVYTIVQI